MTDIWAACSARAVTVTLSGDIHRLVESQEQVATNSLVHTLAEQALLEELIESSKPRLPTATAGLHYLLATPFRYPPLPWGSRFGRRFEPSLFYGARTPDTVLAEAAYYRFVFWSGMAEPPREPLRTRHTLFVAELHTSRALQLQNPPFADYVDDLQSRTDYTATQALGTAMRDHGIEAFEYPSARDPAGGLNVALYTPRAFVSTRPTVLDEWLCATSAERVSYYSRYGGGIREYDLAHFTVEGRLPLPAP